MPLEVGARVGEYVIERELGAGAFGTVFAAHHVKDGGIVAIKALKSKSSEQVSRFKREAASLRRIQSDYVGKIIDFVVDPNEGMLIVMEFIDGELLAEILQDTNLSIDEAIELGVHLAQGVADMHAVGVIHRDIKPSNIMIRPLDSGMQRAVIFDLGLSRFNPAIASPEDPSTGDVTQTASRVAIGTPGYMAPEQILDARQATEQSDIYALGVVLYRAVSGQLPFTGTDGEIARKKLLEEAPPLKLGRNDPVAKRLEGLINRCIRRRPEERFSAAHDFVGELLSLRAFATQQEPIRTMPSPYPMSYRGPDDAPMSSSEPGIPILGGGAAPLSRGNIPVGSIRPKSSGSALMTLGIAVVIIGLLIAFFAYALS